MDTLNHDQIKELQEHQAIRYGGWKLAVGILAVFTILAMTGTVSYVGIWLDGQGARVSSMIYAFIATGGFVVAVYFSVHGATLSWLRAYWCRNVRGYVARFYLSTKTGEDGKQLRTLAYMVVTRREDTDFRYRMHDRKPGGTIAISLPLGGWFTQPWILTHDRDQTDRLAGWSVRLRAICKNGVVMVEIRKHNRFWGVAERIVTDVESALRYLEEIATTVGSASGSWSDFVAWMSTKLDVATREREELDQHLRVLLDDVCAVAEKPPFINPHGPLVPRLEGEVRRLCVEYKTTREEVDRYKHGFLPAALEDRDAVRRERDEAIAMRNVAWEFIEHVATWLGEGTRISHSLDGLRISERLLRRLCLVYEADAVRTEQYTRELAAVCVRIADKEKRDRRRHGKPTTPPAS